MPAAVRPEDRWHPDLGPSNSLVTGDCSLLIGDKREFQFAVAADGRYVWRGCTLLRSSRKVLQREVSSTGGTHSQDGIWFAGRSVGRPREVAGLAPERRCGSVNLTNRCTRSRTRLGFGARGGSDKTGSSCVRGRALVDIRMAHKVSGRRTP